MAMDIDLVLNQMRREHTPTAEDQARVRKAISAAILVGGAAGSSQLAAGAGLKSGASLKAALVGMPVWFKSAVGAGAVIAAVSGGVLVTQAPGVGHSPSEIVHPPLESVQSPDKPATPQSPVSILPVVTALPLVGPKNAPMAPEVAPSFTWGASSPRQPSGAAEARRSAFGAVRATKPVGDAPVKDLEASPERSLTSLGELQLISAASQALREGRTDEAENALSEHGRRYTNTALAQERGGLELIARCTKSPGGESRKAAEAYLLDSPSSPLAGTIRRECLR